MNKIVVLLGLLIAVNGFSTIYGDIAAALLHSKNTFCRKGDLMATTFSVRSFSGRFCGIKLVASLAETICSPQNFDNYNQSACHKKAQETLEGAAPKTVLKNELSSLSRSLHTKICEGLKNNADLSILCTEDKPEETTSLIPLTPAENPEVSKE